MLLECGHLRLITRPTFRNYPLRAFTIEILVLTGMFHRFFHHFPGRLCLSTNSVHHSCGTIQVLSNLSLSPSRIDFNLHKS
ncbi:hypothetical protein K443DRAFT_359849 [Laccaria amethystina LaAM-08-1]|uniref:Uncharacterized protein n=1 Tax=Laccaria amethystina LaAM-08-1 TaxID=1095629 RepID=A0A0C9XJR1_9AGAR|nr:hypothetical protein K443DRAFT_359849 [Laccaria amethystina LaAM-08-1]